MSDPTQDPQGGGGGMNPSQPGGEGGGGAPPADPSNPNPNPNPGDGGGGEDGGGDPKAPNYVTRETLTGAHNAMRRSIMDDLRKSHGDFESRMTKLIEERLAPKDPDPKGKGGEDPKLDPEQAKILREHQDAVRELEQMRKDLQETQTRERDYRFQTKVVDALTRLGCKKPEVAFKVIASDLQLDETNPDRVFATVKGDWGAEELELDDFLVRVVREDVIPELFEGVTKPGSPAGGDSGGSHYLYTREQISDPAFYRANKDKIRAALEKGLVRGIEKPGA